jgi:hypothetical protein
MNKERTEKKCLRQVEHIRFVIVSTHVPAVTWSKRKVLDLKNANGVHGGRN